MARNVAKPIKCVKYKEDSNPMAVWAWEERKQKSFHSILRISRIYPPAPLRPPLPPFRSPSRARGSEAPSYFSHETVFVFFVKPSCPFSFHSSGQRISSFALSPTFLSLFNLSRVFDRQPRQGEKKHCYEFNKELCGSLENMFMLLNDHKWTHGIISRSLSAYAFSCSLTLSSIHLSIYCQILLS